MRLEVEYNIHHGISRMIKIVMLIMLVTHLVGCFWFLIGLGGDEEDMLNAGWVYRYYLDQSPKAVQYVASVSDFFTCFALLQASLFPHLATHVLSDVLGFQYFDNCRVW